MIDVHELLGTYAFSLTNIGVGRLICYPNVLSVTETSVRCRSCRQSG
jgi:hypothetical protein